MSIIYSDTYITGRYHNNRELAAKYHGDRLVWRKDKGSRLPLAYQEVEYIKSADAKIKLNYIPNVNTEVECEFMRNSKTGEQYIFHTYPTSSSSSKRCSFMLINSDNKHSRGIFGTVNNENDEVRITPISVGSKMKLKFNSSDFSLNDVVYQFKHSSVTLPAMDNMWVFGTRSGANAYMNMYTFKIFENGVTKINLVPCYRKADSKVGMYDTITDTFYTSQTATDFIPGPKVKCNQLEYIENPNSNYIDLKKKLKSSYKTRIEYQVPQTETENRGLIFGTRGTNTNETAYSLDKAYALLNWLKTGNTPMSIDIWESYTVDGSKRRYVISEADRYKKLLVEISDTTIRINDVVVKRNTAISPEITTVKSACVFGSPVISLVTTGDIVEYINTKIFSVNIKNASGETLLDLIPYQIGAKIGLLDKVTKVFYSGEFVNKNFIGE